MPATLCDGSRVALCEVGRAGSRKTGYAALSVCYGVQGSAVSDEQKTVWTVLQTRWLDGDDWERGMVLRIQVMEVEAPRPRRCLSWSHDESLEFFHSHRFGYHTHRSCRFALQRWTRTIGSSATSDLIFGQRSASDEIGQSAEKASLVKGSALCTGGSDCSMSVRLSRPRCLALARSQQDR